MGKYEKLYAEIMGGKRDRNIAFDELCVLLQRLGFIQERIAGSHHVFSYRGVMELIDLQPDKHDHSKAKAYQIRQVRSFFKKYLEGIDE